MSNVDGKIRVGFDLDTRQFKNGISTIESNLKHLDRSFIELSKKLEATDDLSAFKTSAEGLARQFIAIEKAVDSLMTKANSSSKVNLVDYESDVKNLQSLKKNIEDTLSSIKSTGLTLDVGIDTDISKEMKTLYSELRRNMDGISLDVNVIPHVDTSNILKAFKQSGDIELDTAKAEEELTSLDIAVSDFYSSICYVGQKISTFSGDKSDLSAIFGDEDKVKRATDTLATASAMLDSVQEKMKNLGAIQTNPSSIIKSRSNNIYQLLGVYKMYVDEAKKLGIEFGKNTNAALLQMVKFPVSRKVAESSKGRSETTPNNDKVLAEVSEEQARTVEKANKAKEDGVDLTQSLTQDELALARVSEEQARTVEKANKAKEEGVDLTQSLTQDELALARAAERTLELEQKKRQERLKEVQDSTKQRVTSKVNSMVDSTVASSVVDLPREQSKLERLSKLANDIKTEVIDKSSVDGKIRVGVSIDTSNMLKDVERASTRVESSFEKMFKSFESKSSSRGFDAFVTSMVSEMHKLSDEAGNLSAGLKTVLPQNVDSTTYTRAINAITDRMRGLVGAAEIGKQALEQFGASGVDISAFEKEFIAEFARVMPRLRDAIQTYANKMEIGQGIPFDWTMDTLMESINTGSSMNSTDMAKRVLVSLNDAFSEVGKEIDIEELLGFSNIDANFDTVIDTVEDMAKATGTSFAKIADLNNLRDNVKGITAEVKTLSQATRGIANAGDFSEEHIKTLTDEYNRLVEMRKTLNAYKDSVGDVDFLASVGDLDAQLKRVDKTITDIQNKNGIEWKFEYQKSLGELSTKINTIKQAVSGVVFNFKTTGDVDKLRHNLDLIKQEIAELNAKREELNNKFAEGTISEVQFIADTAAIDQAITELEETSVKLELEINPPDNTGFDFSSLANSLSGKFGKVKMILSNTVEAMKKLFEFADYMVGEFEEAVDTAKKLNSALKKVASTSFDLSRGILAFSHDALEALGITEQLNGTMSSIGFGDLVGADLLADAIRELSSALKDFSNDALDSGSAFQSYYLRISDIFGKSKDAIYDYAKTSTNMLGMSETAYMEAASKIGVFAKGYIKDTEDLANVTAGLTTAIADLSAQTGFTIDDTMEKLLSGIRGNTEAIEELGINVKVADLQTWLDTEGINAKFENLNSTMQNLYRTWYILDKVQSNGTMGYASKMVNTYSGQVRILQAQLNDLKTTIGTYLMQALVPVLQLANMILSRLIDIANTVGKAFGFLDKYSFADGLGAPDTSGVADIYSSATDSITGATTAQEELAKATDKTAKAAKKALAPFHQLNILQDNSKSSSTSKTPNVGGSGSVIETTPTLDTGSVKKPVDEWLKALKDAIKAGEWYDVGRLLGQKVNEIIDKLDFKKYRKKLYNGALHLADVFNGLIKTIHFDEIGKKLGDAINTIVNTINLFLDRIDFEEVGTSISDFLRGLLATAEWDKIGRLWSQKTRILTDILHGFVEDMSLVDLKIGTSGWQELGTAFGEFVTGVLDLDWERLGTDIALAMNGVADALISFNDTVDFAGIASRLATGFNNLASTLDGAELGQSIADTINSAIGAIGAFLSEANFLKLCMEIGNALGTALANIDWSEAGDAVTALADGIVSLLAGAVYKLSQNYDKIFAGVKSFAKSIVDWINDPANQDAIAGAVNNFVDMLVGLVSAIDWDKLYTGVKDTLSKIDWADIIYLMHLDEGIRASFKSIFSKSMLKGVIKVGLEFVGELFKELGSGILKAIKGLVGLVGIALLGIPATILAREIQIGASIVDGLIKGITGKASDLRAKVDEFFQSVIDWVKDLFGIHSPSTVFAEIGVYLVEGLIQGIQGMWNTITEFFSEAISNLIDWVKDLFGIHSPSTVFAEIGSFLIQGLLQGIQGVWNTITEFFSGAISSLITSVSEQFVGIKTGIENIFISLSTSISSIWESIRLGIEVAFNAISTTISSIWTSISSTVINIIGGISSKISEVWTSIQTTVTTITSSISSTLTSIWNGISTSLSSIVTSIKDTVTSVFTTLSTNVGNAFDGIREKVVGVFNSIAEGIKSPINGIIGIVESMVNFIISGINSAVNAINSFKIELPSITNPITGDTVGGQSFGFSLPTLSSVSIPRLATGAVIQPNHEFAAILGDQRRGVNIEAPLDTIKAGVRDVLGEYGGADVGTLTAYIYLGDDLIEEKVVEIVKDNNFRSNGR